MATDTVKAGVELDAQVAEEVMESMPSRSPEGRFGGPTISPCGWWIWNGMGWMPNKHPSIDWRAAGEVLAKRPHGVAVHSPDGELWRCIIGIAPVPGTGKQKVVQAAADTGPLAICLAALEAVRQSK